MTDKNFRLSKPAKTLIALGCKNKEIADHYKKMATQAESEAAASDKRASSKDKKK